MKTLKKFVALMTLAAVVAGPAQALAATSTTQLTKSSASTPDTPTVYAKWEMNGYYTSLFGTDDSSNDGAQFNASGQYNVGKKISICGLVSDTAGVAAIDGVYADYYYPTNIGLGPDHAANRQGCGQRINQCQMVQLSANDAKSLFCDKIRNNNGGLVKWLNTTEQFNDFCSTDASLELLQNKAAIYCCNHELSYEDPAGMYNTVVFAQDGGNTASLTNQFEYLPTDAYATDFEAVNYGSDVQRDIPKNVDGDFNFCGEKTNSTTCAAMAGCEWKTSPNRCVSSQPTIRNLGNTRLRMIIWQDDMGFGKTGTAWDVSYGARIMTPLVNLPWKSYSPFIEKYLPIPPAGDGTALSKELNLSETAKMDFQVLVKKWLQNTDGTTITSYDGKMYLEPIRASQWECTANSSQVQKTTAPTETGYPVQ